MECHISIQKNTEETVSKNVQLVNRQDFDKMIFKENLEKYHDFIRSKLAEFEQDDVFTSDYHD
ncbi:MAG: hypothetical protein ACRD47_01820 [Nitrososphaeraceae archaeon]